MNARTIAIPILSSFLLIASTQASADDPKLTLESLAQLLLACGAVGLFASEVL